MSRFQRAILVLLFLNHYFRLTFIVHPNLLHMELIGEILTSESAKQKYKLAQGNEYQQCMNEFILRVTVNKEDLNENKYDMLDVDLKWDDLEEAGLLNLNRKKLMKIFRKQMREN